MHTIGNVWLYLAFFGLVAVMLLIDFLGFRQKQDQEVKLKTAAYWSIAWVSVATLFGAGLWLYLQQTAGITLANSKVMEYFAGYLLEKSLATGGLVTITIAGEVAAVQSSVDAAVASIARIEGAECVSRHVIPRPDAELEHILLLQPRSIEIEAAAPAEAAQEGQTSMTDPADKAKPATQAAPPSKEKLSGMSINKLRQLA